MNVTSRHVARLAGVSQPTVSRALSNQPGVSDETRLRITDAARKLGYIPSQTGRSLVTRRTNRVAVVTGELQNPFYAELVGPLHDALHLSGYRMMLLTDRDAQSTTIEQLADGSLDGVVLTTTREGSNLYRELSQRGIPCILANRDLPGEDLDSCVADNFRGAALMGDLLLQYGHRRIGCIFGPTNTSTSTEREKGLYSSLGPSGAVLLPGYAERGEFEVASGAAAFERLFSLPSPPSAVFCANDVLAIGAINSAKRMGLTVPDDVTIVGFDDIAAASWDVFRLTTVKVDLESLAKMSVEAIIRRIMEPDAPTRRWVVPVQVVSRLSHSRPRQ